MTKSFIINSADSFIEQFDQQVAKLKLVAKGGGSEVLLQEIRKGEVIVLEPGLENQMEFFYILEGSIEFKNGKSLSKGDSFYVRDIDKNIVFTTKSDIKLLYFSTEPVFHFISNTTQDLVNMAHLVEEKDHYTRGHIKRVNKFSLLIGMKLGFDSEQIEQLGYAAILHDIGKINVPDEILNKKGKLTNEEYEIVKDHSVEGAKIVESTYYDFISDIIDQHHERIDGNGYPKGLKGDQIRIEAKIIAVADAFDAMISDRPYKKGYPINVAIDELKRCSGTQFDTVIVNTFIDALSEIDIDSLINDDE